MSESRISPGLHTRFRVVLLVFFALAISSVFAHRPYTVPEGTFTRSDGTTIVVQQLFGDGILGRDPGCVQFVANDGSVIVQTPMDTTERLVRISPSAVEILEYKNSNQIFPVATRALLFDGEKLSEVPMDGRRFTSFVMHVQRHLLAYCLATLASGICFAAILTITLLPKGTPTVVGGILATVFALILGVVTLFCVVMSEIFAVFWILASLPVCALIAGIFKIIERRISRPTVGLAPST